MGYKLKPNKSMLSRFKVSRTGKVKRHHAKTSHLLSRRKSEKKRELGRPAILHEGLAKNMRRMMGVGGTKPRRTAHFRALALKKAAESAAQAPAA